MVVWSYENKVVSEVPKGAFGFIYLITYENGSKYIGKKQLLEERSLPMLKNGQTRSGHVGFMPRKKLEMIEKISDWQNYEGSSELTKDLVLVSKEILEWAPTKRSLTYLEVKWMFKKDVLEDPDYLNGNILAKFFRNNLL